MLAFVFWLGPGLNLLLALRISKAQLLISLIYLESLDDMISFGMCDATGNT